MTTVPTQADGPIVERSRTAEDVANRLVESTLGAVDLLAIHLGERLGLYQSLAEAPLTPADLAVRAGIHERYAREWLEQQAVTDLLSVTTDGDSRRYSMPEEVREVLLDQASLNFVGPLARMIAATTAHLPGLLDAYRTGGGVSWQTFGADARESQAEMNRPWFEQMLPDALASIPQVDGPLRQPGARVADLGCGAGWSSIAIARAYPGVVVDGYDADSPSVSMARTNAADAGLTDRIRFAEARVGEEQLAETYDVAFAFECVHDLSAPVEFLAAARRSLRPQGVMVVMDEAVAPEFSAPGDDLARLMYGFSLFVCLPDGMSHQPSAGTGTVMRESTLRTYAEAAGFTSVSVLPIEDFGFWRFYLLS
jgi:SAM-dependent methyltransferase